MELIIFKLVAFTFGWPVPEDMALSCDQYKGDSKISLRN